MANPVSAPAGWTEDLIRFLQSQPSVSAVRVNPTDRTVALATLGTIDVSDLEAQLAEVLRAVDQKLAETGAGQARPVGFVVRESSGVTTIERPTCATAPRLWQWRDFQWPEPDAVQPSEPEWKLLALLATVCGVGGLTAFALSATGAVSPVVVNAIYGVALIAGGWDAVIDTGENLRRWKVDIHFLMLAVAVGAVLIGAWGEASLLLFLFSASGAMELP